MDLINSLIGTPLGYLFLALYRLCRDYGLAILVFTLCTKVIMFPISLLVQKNSIKMVKMRPRLDALRYQYVDDKDAFLDAQTALYKSEHYSPMAGVWPLLLQLPIIFGLLDVVYKPLKHLLHISAALSDGLVARAAELLGTTVEELGSTAQLTAVEQIRLSPDAFASVPGASYVLPDILALKTDFLGIDLTATPSVFRLDLLFLIPVLAGLSALVMCVIQNKINVLQIEQDRLSQWGMTAFMIAFSTFFAFIVPAGVGLYWTFGNLFSIGVMYLVNAVYSPKKYIDYKALEAMKKTAAEERAASKRNRALAKKYYREFFSPENVRDARLVFYSESSGFYKYFRAIIEALLEKNDALPIYYVTSDPDDAVFKQNNPRIRPFYVDETRLISLMMKLEADVVVMTTPDLDKYHIKRSRVKPDVEYIYTDHGCSSLNLTYRTGALDAFSTVFAVSREQAMEVRAMEKLRHTKKKRIIECGYGLIDSMIADYAAHPAVKNSKKTILVAPSWQYDNIMDSCLDPLVASLAGSGYRVVVRPHPQYVRRFPAKMEAILEKYRPMFSDDFVIETDFSSNVTVYTADLLITDWSGIAYEFSFTKDLPSLFINTEMKVVNPEYKKVPLTPFDITARSKIGVAIEKNDAGNAAAFVDALLNDADAYRGRIRELKESYFYNLGHSGEVAADYILYRLGKRGALPRPAPSPAREPAASVKS